MSYTNTWDNTKPTGSEAANTIDDIFRSVKVDIEERFKDMFGTMPSFATDPLRLYGLKFTDAQDSKLFLGDNSGPSRSLLVRNKADSVTYFSVNSVLNTSAVPLNVSSAEGLALGSISGRRRIDTTSSTNFRFLSDADGFANVGLATLTASTRVIAGTLVSTAVANGVFSDGTALSTNGDDVTKVLGSLISVTNANGANTYIADLTQIKQSVATTGTVFGQRNWAWAAHTSGTVVALLGTDGGVDISGNGGTTTRATGVNASAIVGTGATVTDLRMMHVGTIVNTGTITNAYGLLIDAVTAGATLNYAIKTAGGRINFTGLPTSAAGLATGDLWNNSGVINIA